MQNADEFNQIRKVDNINFIVKTFFAENNSETISDKLKAIIENKIDTASRMLYHIDSASAC